MAFVRLRQPLKARAGDRSELALEGATVGDLLRELEQAHPALEGWILDETGAIRRHINVYINGERGGGDTPVTSSDNVDILPAISGGSAS